jgi:hypothetical protein
MTPYERLNYHINAGTLIRRAWTGSDAQGRKTACLLAAMVPACGDARAASVCPADVMPSWLAHLTPWIDDAGTLGAWPGHIKRYAALAARWGDWTPAQWERKRQIVRAACVREAMRHTIDAAVLRICEDVAATLEGGAWPTEEQRAAAATRSAAAAADRLISAILDALEAAQ